MKKKFSAINTISLSTVPESETKGKASKHGELGTMIRI